MNYICGNGNIKLGNMGTFSKLKGNENIYVKKLNCSVCGTCGKYCAGCSKDCYVNASYRYGSVIYGHAVRTIAMRTDIEKMESDIIGQLKRKRKPFEIVRINQSGELETVRELEMWINSANEIPETHFYLYTKAYDFVVPYLLKNADTLPENITILISIWREYGIAEYNAVMHIPNVKAFAYCDGFDYSAHGLTIQTKCKAYEGKKLNHDLTCDKCRKCFDRNQFHAVIGCDAH